MEIRLQWISTNFYCFCEATMGFLMILGLGFTLAVALIILGFVCLLFFGSGWNNVEGIFEFFGCLVILTFFGTMACEVGHLVGFISTNDVTVFAHRFIPKPKEKHRRVQSEPELVATIEPIYELVDATEVLNDDAREKRLERERERLQRKEDELNRREKELDRRIQDAIVKEKKQPPEPPKKSEPSQFWKFLTKPVGQE